MSNLITVGNLRDMKDAPKDRPVMLVEACGRHVEAEYVACKHDGEVVWEGWKFVDEILADLCPMGPDEPGAWYEKPTAREEKVERVVNTKVIEQRVVARGELTEREVHERWREWDYRKNKASSVRDNRFWRDFPGTIEQAFTMRDMFEKGFDMIGVDVEFVAETASMPIVGVRPLGPVDDIVVRKSVTAIAIMRRDCDIARVNHTGEFSIEYKGYQ